MSDSGSSKHKTKRKDRRKRKSKDKPSDEIIKSLYQDYIKTIAQAHHKDSYQLENLLGPQSPFELQSLIESQTPVGPQSPIAHDPELGPHGLQGATGFGEAMGSSGIPNSNFFTTPLSIPSYKTPTAVTFLTAGRNPSNPVVKTDETGSFTFSRRGTYMITFTIMYTGGMAVTQAQITHTMPNTGFITDPPSISVNTASETATGILTQSAIINANAGDAFTISIINNNEATPIVISSGSSLMVLKIA